MYQGEREGRTYVDSTYDLDAVIPAALVSLETSAQYTSVPAHLLLFSEISFACFIVVDTNAFKKLTTVHCCSLQQYPWCIGLHKDSVPDALSTKSYHCTA